MAKLEINASRCKSCALCIHVCPKQVLDFGKNINAKGYHYVVAVKEDACIACAMCAQMCPDEAIGVYKEEA